MRADVLPPARQAIGRVASPPMITSRSVRGITVSVLPKPAASMCQYAVGRFSTVMSQVAHTREKIADEPTIRSGRSTSVAPLRSAG